jgi:hypothetical protein
LDDVHLIVTVLDASGRAISNSPPVELSIVSGPGEFPTGPSIQFDADTDIPIRDGQAAIEFRSYWAGQTVIRASSAGLQSADLTLTTTGLESFVPGVTPAVKPRPYVRFIAAGSKVADESFGRDKPTRASSEAPSHNAGLANDGKADTFWKAGPDDRSAWWQVDLERVCVVSSVKLVFPSPGKTDFAIQVSDDGDKWRDAGDSSEATVSENACTLRFKARTLGQYVRVSFTGTTLGGPAALSEFEVIGHSGSN